jgi:hypothetical protein
MSDRDGRIRVSHVYESHFEVGVNDIVLARYMYCPEAPQVESPKPYFEPVRTLAGDIVTVFRPHDHVWHKGVYLGLPYVSDENLYGGPTYVDGQGYVFLDNNGSMRHESFSALDLRPASFAFVEHLGWFTHDGLRIADERRDVTLDLPDLEAGVWFIRFSTSIANRRDEPLVFSSPTVRGRPQAGYGGLMWRGPRSFTGGQILGPEGRSGPEMMGKRAEWLAFIGCHDGSGNQSTIVFVDADREPRQPTQWFVRTEPYAMMGTAPFFDADVVVPQGESFRLACSVVVACGALGADDIDKYITVHDLAHVAPGQSEVVQ